MNNPRHHPSTLEILGALHDAGGHLTTLQVSQRLRANSSRLSSVLSRLATYGKINRTYVTERSGNGGVGLNRTYCLWNSRAPSQAAGLGRPAGESIPAPAGHV